MLLPLVLSIVFSTNRSSIYINFWGATGVVLGTLGMLFISLRKNELLETLQLLPKVFEDSTKSKRREFVQKIILVAKEREQGKKFQKLGHWVFDKAMQWIEKGIQGESLDLLIYEASQIEMEQWSRLKGLVSQISYYPIPLGMAISLIQVIDGFSGLASSEGQRMFGVGVAGSLVPTLYALLLTHLLFKPIQFAIDSTKFEHDKELKIVNEAIKMIADGSDTHMIEERLSLFEHEAA